MNPIHIKAKGTYVVDPKQFYLLLFDCPHVANYVRVVRIFCGVRYIQDSAQLFSTPFDCLPWKRSLYQ